MKHALVSTLLLWTGLVWGLTPRTTEAAGYPDRPIQLVIPGPAGSVVDITGRVVAEELEKILGTKVVTVNKPGASFTLGTDFVARSKKDGYTISYTPSAGIVTARAAQPETVPYDPDKDLEPLGVHLFFPTGVAVQAGSPWKTFGELAAYSKAHPGEIRVSTSGKFPVAFFVMKLSESATGANFTQVPYEGGQDVTTALLRGDVEASYDAYMKFIPHVKAGKLRFLLVGQKVAELPDVPTLQELGYRQEVPATWFAFYGPAGLPEDVKRVLLPALEKAINSPAAKAKVEKMGFMVDYKAPPEQKALIAQEFDDTMKIMKAWGSKK